MRFTQKGLPILTLDEKLAALKHCILAQRDEDALAHIHSLQQLVLRGQEESIDLGHPLKQLASCGN